MWKPDEGGDPNALVPTWVQCRICDLYGQAEAAGPPVPEGDPAHGWHLVLKPAPTPDNSTP